MLLLSEIAAHGRKTVGGFGAFGYRLLFVVGLVVLIVGYVELRVPVPVEAQGGDAVYNTVRTAVPIEPQYLGSGTPAMFTFLRGDGVWAGVSPPTVVSWITSQFVTTSSSYQNTGISITVDVPSATSDVLLNARIHQDNNCQGRLIRGTTTLQGTGSLIGELPNEYTFVDHDPGIGQTVYTFEARKAFGGSCTVNTGGRGISILIGQVLR